VSILGISKGNAISDSNNNNGDDNTHIDYTEDLENLRSHIRAITEQIMTLVKKRLDTAKAIGIIKRSHGLEIIDERAEDDLRRYILDRCDVMGLDRGIAGRLLSMLVVESRRVQMSDGINEVSNKGQMDTPTSIFAKTRMLEGKGKRIVHLEIGEPNLGMSSRVRDALLKAIDDGRYHYTESRGIAPLREIIAESISAKYGVNVNSSRDIIVTVGGRLAVSLAMLASLKYGDEVIVIEPTWPAYREISEFMGVKVRVLRSSLEDSWSIDLDSLDRIMRIDGVKAIVLNYPNNPTGKILEYDKVAYIVDRARSKGMMVISDEVYSSLTFNTRFKSILEYGYENSIVINSLSKSHGLTGLRLGYAVSYNSKVVEDMVRLQGMLLTCVPEPIQYTAIDAIKDDATVKRNVEVIGSRVRSICHELNIMKSKGIDLRFMEPDGAMYVFVMIPSGIEVNRLIDELLDHGVAVSPGSAFGSDEYCSRFIRISASVDGDALLEGMRTLASILASKSV
jgi:aspartate aminotransferase